MKKNGYLFFLFSILFLTLSSCRKDFDFEPLNHSLVLSKDTIFLDTIFTNTSTTVQRLKVYNKSNKNISIHSVRLANGMSSDYQLIVDGLAGKQFSNVEILAKDSLAIFISAHVKGNNTNSDYLYTDQILFSGQSKTQKVELVTLAKDAVLLYPKKTKDGRSEQLQITKETKVTGFVLDKETLQLNATKPYVIYGYAVVPENKKLTIAPGTTLYFHSKSGLIAQPNSTIEAIGTIEKPIVMRSNRIQEAQRYTTGLWNGIWLNNTSNSILDHVILTNAYNGIFVDGVSNLTLNSVQIYNSENTGLFARNSTINATNTVIGTALRTSLSLNASGDYTFTHCTIANFSNRPDQKAVQLIGPSNSSFKQINFSNSLIYSNLTSSLAIQKELLTSQNLLFYSNVIRDLSTDQEIYTNQNIFQSNVILNNRQAATLYFANSAKNNLAITDQNSLIIGKAAVEIAKKAPIDITGKSRINAPDYGAYQYVPSLK